MKGMGRLLSGPTHFECMNSCQMIHCCPLFQDWRADHSSWTHTGEGKAVCTVTLISSDCLTAVMRRISGGFRWKRELVLLTQRACGPLWLSRHTSQRNMSKKNFELLKWRGQSLQSVGATVKMHVECLLFQVAFVIALLFCIEINALHIQAPSSAGAF